LAYFRDDSEAAKDKEILLSEPEEPVPKDEDTIVAPVERNSALQPKHFAALGGAFFQEGASQVVALGVALNLSYSTQPPTAQALACATWAAQVVVLFLDVYSAFFFYAIALQEVDRWMHRFAAGLSFMLFVGSLSVCTWYLEMLV